MERNRAAKQIFAENLRWALKQAGMTQTELGKRTGLSRDAISSYANQRTLPSTESRKKMARALKIGLEDLLPANAATERANSLTITAEGGTGARLEARVHNVPMDVLTKVVELLRPFVGLDP